MEELPVVIVYKTRNRDLTPIREVCKIFNFPLHITENEGEFSRVFLTSALSCVIIPLGSDKEGGDNAREFINMASKLFDPEDADVAIIYSTEGFTPERWPKNLDPRPIYSYDIGTSFIPDDKGWRYTIEKMEWLRNRFRYQRDKARNTVNIKFAGNDGAFTTEASFLLRAAFKEMSSITVEFPKQGFSGSIVCAIQPFDISGQKKALRYLVKIYHNEQKAFQEFQNYQRFVCGSIPPIYHPKHDPFRSYRGKAFSIFVTDLIEGPKGKPITLRELIISPDFTIKEVEWFISKTISVLNNNWSTITSSGQVDLMWEYLRKCLDGVNGEKRKKILLSFDSCHRWFGCPSDDANIEERLKSFLSVCSPVNTTLKKCHGDLHTDNILVGHYEGKLIPVFIDFSETDINKHCILDLVTLESDVIIRCLDGIEIDSFIDSLTFPKDSETEKIGFTGYGTKSTQTEKVYNILRTLRNSASSEHGVKEKEYLTATLLKTLEFLSFGDFPPDENTRATKYVDYLIRRLKTLPHN